MKYGIWKFFNRKNAVVFIALPLTVLALIVSIAAFALTNRKQPYPVTSFGENPNFSYQLYFDRFNQSGDHNQTSIKVNKKLLQDALKKIGATKNKPLPIFSKLMEDTITTDKLAWLEALKYNLQYVSDGLMDFGWEARTGTSVPMMAWKTDGNCPTGYMSWSPDYNGPGTWFEPYFLLKDDGSAGFSSWSAWPSVYKHLCFINSVIKQNRNYKAIKEFNGWSTDYVTGEVDQISKKPKTINYFDIGRELIGCLTRNKIVKDGAFNRDVSPTTIEDAWHWDKASQDVFTPNGATQLGAEIGSWVNEKNYHALWLERVMDNQMAFIPMSQTKYLTTTSLRTNWLFPRNSDSINYRDYGKKVGTPQDTISLANPARIFEQTKTPLNPCFQDWPTATYFGSTLGPLLSWVTRGDVSGLDKSENVIPPELYLQITKAVVMYKKDNDTPIGVIFRDQTSQDDIKKKYGTKLDSVPSFCGKIDLQQSKLKNILSQATRYEFSIDTELQWIDRNGEIKGHLDAKDVQRGVEAYWFSSACGLNINGYFLDMSNVDVCRTLEKDQQTGFDKDHIFDYNDILNPKYNINEFQPGIENQRFNFYLKKPYPLFLDVTSKESFSPLPYQNPKVKNIATTQQIIDSNTHEKGKVVLKKGQIDDVNTNFNDLFGCGPNFEKLLNQYWTVGPYTVNKINGNQIVFSRNKTGGYYGEDMKDMPWYKRSHGGDETDIEEPIDRVILYYGTGNESVYFEKFAAGQLDYVTLQTMNKILAAYADKKLACSILNTTPWKTFMSNYVIYTGHPYRNENGKFVKQSNLSDSFYRLMQWWHDDTKVTLDGYDFTRSDLTKIIRSVFFGLINFAQLSRIQTSSGSFQYSIVPYGVMKLDYIEKDGTGKESVKTAELYHYIHNNEHERPGAMLKTLDQYTNPLDDPCPFIPTKNHVAIKERE